MSVLDSPVRTRISRDLLGVRSACLAAALTHAALLRRALGPDEGGFLVVARHWHDAGAHLYGPLWVDRPPGLIGLFAIANALGPWGVRLVALVLAVALVALAGATARRLGGPPAARWAAWTAYALGSSVLLQAQQLNGEYAAAVCVSASMLATVAASRARRDAAFVLGVASGAAAAAAIMMKQNFLDGFVFAAALLVATELSGRSGRARHLTLTIAGGGVVGAALVAAAAFEWSQRHGGPSALMWAMYGFRARAAEVMDHFSWAAPDLRLLLLIALALGSGLIPLGIHLAAQGRHALRARNPVAWALAATAAFELVSCVAGGNFWPHYALAFVPVVSIAAGLGAQHIRSGSALTRRIITVMAVATAVISPAAALVQSPGEAWQVGHWVHRSARPGDTIVVPYTHANVIAASGLTPAYPYLWSLPTRTLDPDLTTLTAVLDRPGGATWVVFFNRPRSWELDRHGQVERALHEHYRRIAVVCDHSVWLRSDATRSLAPVPVSCGGGAL